MPPTRVLISTCLSCPSFCFFTLMLHPRPTTAASPRASVPANRTLILAMRSPSLRNLRGTLQSCAALRDARNRDRQTAANRNLSKQCLDRRYLRDRRVGKRAHVIFDLGKIARQVRIPHGHHC